MSLHQIDKPSGGYTKKELDEFMVFCILDTAVSYEMVCKTFNGLRKNGMTTRRGIRKFRIRDIEGRLKHEGYRFPSQHAKRIKAFGDNPINLSTATRDELVKNVNGIGMKLASMFLRNTRGEEHAVLDVHTLRWLKKNYGFSDKEFKKMTYNEKEEYFKKASEFLGKTTTQLDLEIWEANRIGNR